MGVKGLWKILNSIGKKTNPTNCTLAIDVSIWIYQYKGLNEPDAIYYISKRIIKLIYHNIKPVFVFDGPPNEFKRKVIEQRKKENFGNLIKDIINNKICKKCNIKVRICKHGGMIKDNLKKFDISNIPEWGKSYIDPDLENIKTASYNKSDKLKDIYMAEMKNTKNSEYDIQNLKTIISSETYTVNEKLKLLVKLREKRKERLEIDDTTMLNFSKSQIKNVKNRNFVSHYIRKLEQKNIKTISSDCKKSFVFTKNQNVSSNSDEEIDGFLEIKKSAKNDNFEINNYESNKTETFDNFEKNNNKNLNTEYINIINTNYEYKHSFDEYKSTINNKIVQNSIISADEDLKKINIKSKISDYMKSGFFVSENEYQSSDEEQHSHIIINKKQTLSNQSDLINDYSDNAATLNNESSDFLSIQSLIKKIISVLNLPFIDSPSESDAQCGYLCKQNLVDGVITEDNDILLYGGTVFKNFFRKNKYIVKYDPQEIEKTLGLSTIDLINIGFVLGSDYTMGIKGIGIKRAIEYIQTEEFKSIEKKEYLKIYLDSKVNTEWHPKFGVLEVDKFIRFLKNNNVENERIAELEFYFNCKTKDNL